MPQRTTVVARKRNFVRLGYPDRCLMREVVAVDCRNNADGRGRAKDIDEGFVEDLKYGASRVRRVERIRRVTRD